MKVNVQKVVLNTSDFHCMGKNSLCSKEEINIGMTQGYVTDDRIFIFGLFIPLNLKLV